MSAILPWLKEPAIDALVATLLDRLDRMPAEERTRAPGIRINPKTMPLLFDSAHAGEPEYLWSLIQKLGTLGWITIAPGKAKSGKAAYEVEPRICVVLAKEAEIRQALGRDQPVNSYAVEWDAALGGRPDISDGLYSYLKVRPIRISSRSASDVLERLFQIQNLVEEPLFLREVSGRVFWGHAKTLDHRAAMVAQILGKPECPFPELPVLMHSHCTCAEIKGILFIENEASFLSERVRSRANERGFALFFASGFKLAAARLREPEGSALFHSTASTETFPGNCIRIQKWLHRKESLWPVLFWGDLDFASMEILKRLRQSFPEMTAWREGYEPMAQQVHAGEGFHFFEVEKKLQIDPVSTGCEYADAVLLPLIRDTHLFCHQEQ